MSEAATLQDDGPGRPGDGGADESDGLPLFILSPGQRDELSLIAARLGWKPIAARSRDGAESRFLGSLARVALIDLRGQAGADAVATVSGMAGAVEASGGAMLALVDDMGAGGTAEMIAAGVTHLLDGEVTDGRLAMALRSADKLAERLSGSVAAARNRHAVQRSDALFWRWSGAERVLSISPALARLLDMMAPGVDHSRWRISDLVKALPRGDRVGAIAAIRHAVDDLMPAAFAHAVPGQPARRLVQHLYPDANGFSGEVEELDIERRAESRDRDPMTGLASRQGAVRWLDDMLGRDMGVVALLLGLGEFDRVNGAYGRLVGDAMLARVALRLTRLIDAMGGRHSLVARLSGTEFLIGLAGEQDGADALIERAALLARQLVTEIDRPFNAGDYLIRLSGRCGIARAEAGERSEMVIRRAGNALADARRGGAQSGIRVRIADEGSRDVADDRLQNDLRHALDNDEIQILFQPQYDMATDLIVGVEALARWQHPQFGEIGAGALFAIAERSDFLLPLSDHIHGRALSEAAAWPAALGDLRLSINVTAADISEPDFLARFLQRVDAAGLERGRVTVELTESGLVENLESAARLLGQLREAGFLTAIDDFGTGYSSLAYLKALPLDYLKIDSSIAQDIAGSGRDRIIVRAIIDMARELDLGVIAEGVETRQQLALLARAGATCYQGFLRSPPVTSAALAELVREDSQIS